MIRVQVSCIALLNDKIVMIKKKDKTSAVHGYFIPPGGHVELHETLEQACKREMFEETGLIVDDLELRGVSFIAHTSDYHSVCFWYMTRNVKGKLELKEPEKLTPHLVEIETLYYNKEVTDYHRAFIKEIVEKGNFLNGIVEWCKPDNSIKWSILENTPKNPEYPRYNKEVSIMEKI
ncbi:NUDIX hydrolase [Geobacillus subterraneus]|uniref:Nudix hydrolase domain-containing protein n=1 Tax=Geobacillus subterraneus TaxID=129338 RepID=A0A679FUX3_9BACL|nr:NUDIX hydrolase [Geobacillus subterraneus]BBW98465.1 hypothetical protein GsuE55_32980 [Geobacillus subterraneus]